MPSYDDFNQNPTHLYQLKQERLQNLLSQQNFMNIQQPAPVGGQVSQSQRWSNEK